METHAEHRTFISGPELREEREAAELTQAELAAAMGVHRTTVAVGEARAKVRPSFARRYREAIAKLVAGRAA